MKEINKEVREILEREGHVTLGFSTGKDSLACAMILKKMGIDFTPFFFYHCPELEFVDRNVKMYEDIFEMDIVRMPHPMLYDYLRHQDFQFEDMIYYLDEMKLQHVTFADMMDVFFASVDDKNSYYDIVGVRACESFNRRMVFKKQGFINHEEKKISLIADWTETEVYDFLKEEKIPLTDDYKIWNRSFDGLKYQFLFGVKEHYPKDWEVIKEYFPLIELELFRYTKNREYYV